MNRSRRAVRAAIAIAVAGAALGAAAFGLLRLRSSLQAPTVEPALNGDPTLPQAAFVPSRSGDGELVFDLRWRAVPPLQAPSAYLQLIAGWSGSESWGTWSLGPRSVLSVRLDEPADRQILLNTRPLDDLFDTPQRIRITANDRPLGELTLYPDLPVSNLAWPEEDQRSGVNTLVFEPAATTSPAERGLGRDQRQVGFGLRALAVTRATPSLLRGRARAAILMNRLRRTGAVRAGNGDASDVRISQPGTLVHLLDPSSSREVVEIRVTPPESTVRFAGMDLDGVRSQVETTAGSEPGRFTVRLPGEIHGPRFLLTEVDASQDPTSVEVIRQSAAPPRRHPDPVATPPPGANVVVIVLDAARPDRFGCYGAERDTTPHIDTLAAESLVFDSVFALAPYTLCSVPTMLTGLSFLDHGVVMPDDKLAGEATTLAEILAAAGYRTGGFSSTPNNSRAKGFDQGYEVFVEDWSEAERRLPIDPHRLVGHAVEWLETVPAGQPYHMLVHMVPPHEPYHPGPRFDRFTEPGYDGPVDGDLPWNLAFNAGAVAATEADRAQLNGLYDGNLLRADHATGRLLEALRQRADWPDTVVLVTSDHGEALMEHGVIGHNASVYDEMLRVPFILRLPRPAGTDTVGRFGSLADLPPTLLAAAGLPRQVTATSRDLLDEQPDEPRALVVRTSHRRPIWGVRTHRFALIHRSNAASELYDVVTDPGQERSIADQRRVLTAALRQVLSRRRDLPAVLDPARVAPVSATDREMLEALGYVD